MAAGKNRGNLRAITMGFTIRAAPAVLLATTVASTLGSAAASRQAVFRASSQTVPLHVTVIGPDGRLVTNLTRDDFQVLDNGRPQAITLFDSGVQAITVVVMLDMSGSMVGNIPLLRRAAVQMFTRLGPDDRARVGNFGDRIVISPVFTNDTDDLIRALWLDLKPGGPTPLWGAINAAMAAQARIEGRRVVLVLSDGKNSPSLGVRDGPTLEDVTRRAQTEGFMVYSIGMRSRGSRSARRSSDDEPDPGLRELAHESGGGYFELDGTQNLDDAFARVADELHRQYLIGFAAPEADGKLHQVRVRLNDPGLTARSRQSYQAPKALVVPARSSAR